ncbi:MAG: N-6 DNA methylase [Bacteroidota bacterium]
MSQLSKPKETATRKRLDSLLTNLGWDTDEASPRCNVFTERPKTADQKKKLGGYEPDYVLYESNTDTPIAIIEAKRSGQSLKKALLQAVELYAKPLDIDIIFVADGAIIESYDRRSKRNLRFDGELVTTLLGEKQLLRFVREGFDVRTPEVVRHTKQQLIGVFSEANDLLRKEGLREGLERFTEFSNLLFLKLISEIEKERENVGEDRILDEQYCWDAFKDKKATEMLDYINDTILPRLVDKYNHSGDVFQQKLAITNAKTLKAIVDKLSKLTLLDTDSDIKGDAFEYFLKNSISVGNDLGEYFTPRHIVKLIVDLVDPVFKDRVYDPTCGTGGFLIQAFRHIKSKVRPTKGNLRIIKEKTIYGRELTGTAKIAKMNMIIIGDGHTNIEQMDSLSAPIKGKFEIVLANYPFSQKTDYSALYGLSTENANAIFLKHIIDALKDGGKAGIVVPEGLLFDETAQSVKVRQILLETCEVLAVISLDGYVFQPYTGQPTSILVFKKGRTTKKVWFFEVTEDGFEKSHRRFGRRPQKKNDIPLLRQLWNDKANSNKSFSVSFETIKKHGYILTVDEYKKRRRQSGWVPLGDVCDLVIGRTPSTKNRSYYGGNKLWANIRDISNCEGAYLTDTENKITAEAVEHSRAKLVKEGTVLLSFKLSLGKVAIAGKDLYTNEAIAAVIPKDPKRVLPKYLYHILPRLNIGGGGEKRPRERPQARVGLKKCYCHYPHQPPKRRLFER